MCVYAIMLICVCILCYYVYSVKSSRELVFIVYKNRIQIKFSYLILFLSYVVVSIVLCCVFELFFFVLCALCCQFLWIVHL